LKAVISLRAKVRSCGFAKCSGVVRSTKKCGPMLEAGTFYSECSRIIVKERGKMCVSSFSDS
jgi:hypothetical protein